MEWNNGTVFRVYVAALGADIVNGVVNCKLNINQQLLNGKVFIGVENMVLTPELTTNQMRDYWTFDASSIQLSSINLPPYIDYSSFSSSLNKESSNTSVFFRSALTIIDTYTHGAHTKQLRYGFNQVFNKDSILYEMINNQNALATGNFYIKILDYLGDAIPNGYIDYITFTLVIYKPNNKYN